MNKKILINALVVLALTITGIIIVNNSLVNTSTKLTDKSINNDSYIEAENEELNTTAKFRIEPETGTKYATISNQLVESIPSGVTGCFGDDTTLIITEGIELCRRVNSEGAAGSIYKNYTYQALLNNPSQQISFTLKLPQCLNYPEEKALECDEAQRELNPDDLVVVEL